MHEGLAGTSAVERVRVIGRVTDREEARRKRLSRAVDEAAQAVLEATHGQHVAAEYRQRIGDLGVDERRDARQGARHRVERLRMAQHLEPRKREVRGEGDRIRSVVGGEDGELDPAEVTHRRLPARRRELAIGAAAVEAGIVEHRRRRSSLVGSRRADALEPIARARPPSRRVDDEIRRDRAALSAGYDADAVHRGRFARPGAKPVHDDAAHEVDVRRLTHVAAQRPLERRSSAADCHQLVVARFRFERSEARRRKIQQPELLSAVRQQLGIEVRVLTPQYVAEPGEEYV